MSEGPDCLPHQAPVHAGEVPADLQAVAEAPGGRQLQVHQHPPRADLHRLEQLCCVEEHDSKVDHGARSVVNFGLEQIPKVA